jgi:hypothetical protein
LNLLSTEEAAALKGTSRQVIIGAINRREIDTVQVGKRYAIKDNKKLQEWSLSERHKKAGEVRWSKRT